MIGKGGRIRTVPIPLWAKHALDLWILKAGITDGKVFRAISKRGKVWGKGISQNLVCGMCEELLQVVGADGSARMK